MKAEIIAIGTELLLGQIANTNAQFISESLAEMGINVYYHTVVGDNNERLKEVITHAEKRSDLLIFTGGLGPTKDDLTKETLSEHLDQRLVMDQDALTYIENYFLKVGREMTENNRKQALVLEGCHVLRNDTGMAPGMGIVRDNHVYIMLPGPPSEMKPMFRNYVVPYLQQQFKLGDQIESRVLRFFGIGEAQLETEIMDLIDGQSNPTVAPLASTGEVTLRLTAKHTSANERTRLLNELEEKIMQRMSKYFYGYGEVSLMETLFTTLKQQNKTLAVAESFTGGLFSKEMTAFSGASSVFNGGVTCYTNEAKVKLLGIEESLLNTDGAVSISCAEKMAENIQQLLDTDIGLSFTGVAGPEKSENKEVGTVYIGIAMSNQPTEVLSLQLAGNREMIQIRGVKIAANNLLKKLLNK